MCYSQGKTEILLPSHSKINSQFSEGKSPNNMDTFQTLSYAPDRAVYFLQNMIKVRASQLHIPS